MEFRLLGPLEVLDAGVKLELGAVKQRSVLAVLLLEANEVVSIDRLLDELWGFSPPRTATKAIQVYVSQLRKQLGEDRLITVPPGYMLRAEAGEVDVARAEELIGAAGDADPETASRLLQEALALWRGAPLGDLAFERFAQTEVMRLDELRWVALERRIDADLAGGRHEALLGELRSLAGRHPLRERLHGQLMLALYRSGRQADALDAYRRARQTLVEELGLEPGDELKRLERAMLEHDPALDLPQVPAQQVAAPSPPIVAPTGPATEARKVVTVLFADITGFTSLGESLDPESLRSVLTRYFGRARAIIERHGGFVSKFIGDAVMAVFGIPTRHEDDALRAVRAADEMRASLAELNEEFTSIYGVTVSVRTGLNTGEVLATEPSYAETLVVGDIVNVAARLEQEARPGEILLGEDTYHLVHDAVRAERTEPLELKGKGHPVTAWRLLDVIPDVRGRLRRLDSVLVGREDELRQLSDAFARVAAGGGCELVTLMGSAGVGKSRLTGELIAHVGPGATVLHGRCLSYGEGTFWPVASVVADAIGMEERASRAEAARRIGELLADTGADAAEAELVTSALTSLLGTADTGIQETSWAFRRFLERLASDRPVVVVFDDIHWGEPTFLDLLDYLGDWIQSAPVLILCLARPDLLDVRPDWMTAKPRAPLITLAPLSEQQTDALIRGLVGGTELRAEVRLRIAEVTEGNPLFVEETIRMLVDDGVLRQVDEQWELSSELATIAIPPTILALLNARLDRLEPEQRTVIERASVVGRSFWWGAVAGLAPEEVRPRLGACLQSLVRKELIRPDRSEIRGEDAFRFTHILVRDAAYSGIPKSRRADMHERLADWIDVKTRDVAGEYDEIVAYHLEQGHRALLELAAPNERTAELARRAAERFGIAGARAFSRGDIPAAVTLLSRATELLPARHPQRLELLAELAFALLEAAAFDRLVAVAEELADAAEETADERLRAHAAIIDLWVRFFTHPQAWAADAEREAQLAIATFGRLGEERGVARGWSLLGLVGVISSQFGPATAAWQRAFEHAQRAGNRREALEGLTWVAAALWLGPTPAPEGVRRCREVFEQAQGDRKAMATALFAQGGLEADLGHFDEAHELFGRSRALLQDVVLPVWDAGALTQAIGWAHLLQGHPAAAERELRRGYDRLREIGEVSFLSTVAGVLAEALSRQGNVEEAHDLTRASEENAGGEDIYSQVLWRSVRAKCLVRQGETAAAVGVAREAVELVGRTDSLDLAWHALMSQAEVLRLAGLPGDAERTLREAIATAERKNNNCAAGLARAAVEDLAAAAPADPAT